MEDHKSTTEIKPYPGDANENTAMQCAEIVTAGAPLRISSRVRPSAPDEGVLIRTLCAGVCHSDLHFIDDEQELRAGEVFRHRDILGESFSGVIPGHEICGVIEEIGKEAEGNTSLKIGDTVVVYPWRGCRQCEACSQGHSNLCENNEGGTTDLGQGLNGGGFGSYVSIPEIELCIKLPSCIPPEIGCMLPCSALTAYNAICRARPALEAAVRIRGVANLLVVGVGGVGIWVVLIVKQLLGNGSFKVICADTKREKLDTAASFEADDILEWNINDDIATIVTNTTVSGYNRIDAVLDFVGTPKTIEIGLDCLHKGGTIIAVGLSGGEFKISLPKLICNAVSIQGVRTGGMGRLKELIDLLTVQQIQNFPRVELISLDQINEVLDRLRKGEVKERAVIKHAER